MLIEPLPLNLTLPEVWQEIHEWKEANAQDGFALAMHRPVAALQDLPTRTYSGALHHVLGIVREGGLFMAQIPRQLMLNPNNLFPICESLQERTDIEEIILSAPPSSTPNEDEADSYAVIIKK